jgi:alpha-L-rhamnosidase
MYSIKNAMLNLWWNDETAEMASGSQACQSLALWLGIIPEHKKQQAADIIHNDLVKRNYRITTGNLCTRYLLDALSEDGYIDDAYRIMTSEEYPSLGYMLQNAARTVWERFELKESNVMNSHNHPMLGCPCAWLFRYPAGIRITPEAAGFNRFVLDPVFITDLEHAEAEYASRAGLVKSAWKRTEGGIRYDFTVPPGCTASVRTPAGGFADYGEGSYTLTF